MFSDSLFNYELKKTLNKFLGGKLTSQQHFFLKLKKKIKFTRFSSIMNASYHLLNVLICFDSLIDGKHAVVCE